MHTVFVHTIFLYAHKKNAVPVKVHLAMEIKLAMVLTGKLYSMTAENRQNYSN